MNEAPDASRRAASVDVEEDGVQRRSFADTGTGKDVLNAETERRQASMLGTLGDANRTDLFEKRPILLSEKI
jgi:hypothetical protein